ncbi:MAG: molybdopterin-guanine dinucleotide biosynthesis protein B [Desulfofustis sp. PB-SRB1]|nr:molybdopterin-guanine dinucleotide biosynthesis protein B [Desulfofustis sp. PB-SRB1]MBM1001849.1 molybdopterin-guanine dinucleotide biosynthesis protein B [Desulfofustis sp. PB-SRB1]HBH28115.1 molybdopterin-guanine dinucleotide biosynthesis protein B [Desulfofustis sp.]HBH31201.1 molybdopterin-guanine dinucleotide biosynthesis protein B [Desulfofustis sp.]
MTPIVSFIGRHNAGKTTLARRVVAHLSEAGYRVGAVKSTHQSGINYDQEGTDTAAYRHEGAAAIVLMAPDQTIMTLTGRQQSLLSFVHRCLPDVDIVIAEGFKHHPRIAKIEVARGPGERLGKTVSGVIAVATDQQVSGDYVFRLDEHREIAEFIEKRFLHPERHRRIRTDLLIDGRAIVLKPFVQRALAGVVEGFAETIKHGEAGELIELRIRSRPKT